MFVESHPSTAGLASPASSRPAPGGVRSGVADEMSPRDRIAYQGEPGANSDTACGEMFPELEPLPCPTFEDAFDAVENELADLAMTTTVRRGRLIRGHPDARLLGYSFR